MAKRSAELEQRRSRVLAAMKSLWIARGHTMVDANGLRARLRIRSQILGMEDCDLTTRQVASTLRSLEASGEVVSYMRYFPTGTIWSLRDEDPHAD